MDRYQQRRDRLRKLLRKAEIDSLLVTNFTNVTYLTGFTGDDSYLFISPDREVILSDPRYTTQLGEECPGIELAIRDTGKSMLDTIESIVKGRKSALIGIEGQSMTVGLRDRIAAALPKSDLKPTDGLVERLRLVKDKEEVDVIRRAVHAAERAFEVLRATIRPDLTEKQVADDLEHQMRLLGAKGASFPPIVAVGARAALPHARPTGARLGESPLLLIDWGADLGGYKSDLTRVLATGKISPKLERVYRVVLMAQEQGIAAVRPGATAHEVDAAARTVIEKAGFGKFFGHGLGHGLGLDIHEAPRLGVNQSLVLEPGMVVTIEPGIYLPDVGGVRIEDDVLVTKTGHEVLTSTAKSWETAAVAW
ncbi:MAG TPA: Xaa-Pro peptidase family protein [Pirellulales bacterium]|nr:Xaa-Pro peptidase family protein [Pirellulales bacterium]